MKNIKVVTICGSMKFKKEMIKVASELQFKKGYAVIQCVYEKPENINIDAELIKNIHFKKISISDAIFVVNVNGYIGETTKKEIKYAKSLNKEILSLEPLN